MQPRTQQRRLCLLPALAGTLFMLAAAHASADGIDPDPGESWMQSIKVSAMRDHQLTRAVLLATDDSGVTRQRELRIEARGTPGRTDREVIVHRYEPECLPLAKAAGMTADDFCDRLVLTRGDRDVQLAFHSLDANRRYQFTLVGSNGRWESLQPAGMAAPTLRLELHESAGDASYAWSLETQRARYTQAGVVSARDLGTLRLDGVEASLGGLTDVLHAFNVEEFALADLPRDHRLYEPSPYGLWAEGPLDTHCTLFFCVGSVGGNSGGSSQGMCDPDSPNYTPESCPWDLKLENWPVSHRMRVRKRDDGSVEVFYFVRNDGTGIFNSAPFASATPMAHISLVRFGNSAPLVAPATAPYGDQCYVEHAVSRNTSIDPFNNYSNSLVIQPGDTMFDIARFRCDNGSGRPTGRYHPWAQVDPTDTLDTAGLGGNNIELNRFDWVKLQD